MNKKLAVFVLLLSAAIFSSGGTARGADCRDVCGKDTGDKLKTCMKKCEDKGQDAGTAQETAQQKNTPRKSEEGRCPAGMAFIPAGSFMMGSPESEAGRVKDEVQHRVTISREFCMGKHEVTQGEWVEAMGNNPSEFKNCGSNCPVENISWDEVREFLGKYNELHGGGYRLPTEAEWEYAARGGIPWAFYNGNITNKGTDCGNDPALDRAGWYCGNSGVSYSGCNDASDRGGPKCVGTHPVGQKEPNVYGLYDMLGNVWEWVEDWYGDYPAGEVLNPVGPALGSRRISRGGSWSGVAMSCRAAIRLFLGPGDRFSVIGFRLVRTLR